MESLLFVPISAWSPLFFPLRPLKTWKNKFFLSPLCVLAGQRGFFFFHTLFWIPLALSVESFIVNISLTLTFSWWRSLMSFGADSLVLTPISPGDILPISLTDSLSCTLTGRLTVTHSLDPLKPGLCFCVAATTGSDGLLVTSLSRTVIGPFLFFFL